MPRGKKKKAEEVVEEPSTKKQKQKPVGIDMSHVPASLRLEGYKSDEEERENDKVIPDYLKCPICKEIFVNPEIYKCGHTVCKLCSDDNCNCPVCKRPDQRTTAPNYTLKSVIENQYADLVKDRQKEQDELLNIRNKMKEYPRSARYREIRKYAQIYLTNKVIVSVDDFINYLTTSIKALKNSPIKSPISSEEAKFSIALLASNNLCHFVGQYIVSVIEINEFLRRAKIQEETANKKKTNKTKMTEPSVNLKSWISIVIYYHYSRERTILPSGQFVVNLKENAKQIASLSNLDIGEFVSVEEWKNQPSFWVKDVVLGELETLFLPRNLCGCGRIHHDFEDSDDDDSDSDSDDW